MIKGSSVLKSVMNVSSQAVAKREPLLSETPSSHHDLVFVRHAESVFNLAC